MARLTRKNLVMDDVFGRLPDESDEVGGADQR